MEIVKTIPELLLAKKKFATPPVLVPTMGALHDGHFALIHKARDIAGPNGVVVVSLFVNPIQFNNASDLENYPSTLEADLAACERLGVDLVFTPETASLYAENRSVLISESSLSSKLCGATRPGHFDGVCTVVAKLFNLFTPIDAVFGKKDYQQLAIISRLVRDLNFPIIIHGVDTVREADGLALSSRNVRLTPEHRKQAPGIYAALKCAADRVTQGAVEPSVLLKLIQKQLSESAPDARLDYLECVDAATLQSINQIDRKCVIAIAAFFGNVRLIDNIELTSQF
ncbi:pantoate--beta-alanine ligase [Rubritalea tangerina]|uniref:Pantothenate synthetase n=2 Tax=Rubritalea tangerina TaxID=430798 RepID=A0ABW4Z8K3_9BACT